MVPDKQEATGQLFMADVASGRSSIAVVRGHEDIVRWLTKENLLNFEAQTNPNMGHLLGCVCDTKGEILSQEPDHLLDQQLRDLQMEGDVQDPWFGKDILVGRVIVVDAMAAHKGVSLIQCVPSHSSNGTVVQGDLQGCIVKSWSSAVNDVLQVSISRHHLGQPIVWEEAE